MIVVDYQSAGFIVAFAGVAVALFSYLRTMKQDLQAQIAASEARAGERFDRMDAKLTGEIAASEARTGERFEQLRAEVGDLRSEMREGFAKVGAQLIVLEARTYDLGRALPPLEPQAS